MNQRTRLSSRDDSTVGQQMHEFIAELQPFCRSITGDGVRRTLAVIGDRIPLLMHEVPTGTRVLDWTVPREWNVRDAYVRDWRGKRVIDFRCSNLHVLGYSTPVRGRFRLDELKSHLFTDPSRPEWIPFRYSYYEENWGFCLSHRHFEQLQDGEYEVVIDSSLEDGALTYGECYLPGVSTEEVLISVHTCHPSMCNDNLSGIAVATFLAERLCNTNRRLSYRFIFVPTTIGSITWLSRNKKDVKKIKHGLVITCVGDAADFTYKQTRQGSAEIDRAMVYALQRRGQSHRILSFSPFGFDERQYCSPGFNLPVGCLMRTPYDEYPEYHTSGDNLDLVRPEKLEDSLNLCEEVLQMLDRNSKYLNTSPEGEPQLGKRGIYRKVGGSSLHVNYLAMFWVLNFSDGQHSLLDIAEKSGISFVTLSETADLLREHGLLAPCEQ
jgi:aminopeptidase-like protein